MSRPTIIDIRTGDKLLILGQNGTGKSVIATSIARSWPAGSIVVMDPKGDDGETVVANMAVATTAEDVCRRLPGRVLYRPSLAEYETRRPGDPTGIPPIWARWERICRRLYELARQGHRPTLIVVHELATICSSHAIGHAWAQLIREGRSKGITLVMVTQRPQGTSVLARSEAQHVIAMTLTDQAARDVAAELLGDIDHPELADQIRARPLPLDHTWWYRGPDFRLALHDPLPYQAATR